MSHFRVGIALASFCLALSTGTPVPAQEWRDPQLRGRPLVILIHGRDQAYETSAELEVEWIGSFDDGIRKLRAGRDFLTSAADRALVTYQDVYEFGARGPELCGTDPVSLPEESASSSAYAALTRREYVRDAQSAVEVLRGQPAAMSLLINRLPDVKLYLNDRAARCATDLALKEVLDGLQEVGRPALIVAHSMGAMVTYSVLAANAREAGSDTSRLYDVRRVVTLGAQIAAEGVIPKVMALVGDEPVPEQFPIGRVESWVNVKGKHDLLGFFAHPGLISSGDSRVELHILTDPSDRHAVTGYLKHPLTALSIASAWCDAFEGPAPAECAKVSYTVCDYDRVAESVFAENLRRWIQFPTGWGRGVEDDGVDEHAEELAAEALRDWVARGRPIDTQTQTYFSFFFNRRQGIREDRMKENPGCRVTATDVAEAFAPRTPEGDALFALWFYEGAGFSRADDGPAAAVTGGILADLPFTETALRIGVDHVDLSSWSIIVERPFIGPSYVGAGYARYGGENRLALDGGLVGSLPRFAGLPVQWFLESRLLTNSFELDEAIWIPLRVGLGLRMF